MMVGEKKRTAAVDLEAVSRRLETQAQKLQFGVLSAVDFVFERFKETNPDEPDVLDKMKEEMVVRVVMQAVNTIRGQVQIVRGLDRGNLTIKSQQGR